MPRPTMTGAESRDHHAKNSLLTYVLLLRNERTNYLTNELTNNTTVIRKDNMHSRSIQNFPSRADSIRSNSASIKYKVQRSVTTLKSGGEMKGPSPTSVTTKSFQYDTEEPFDCGPTDQQDHISSRSVPSSKSPKTNPIKYSAQSRTKVPPLSPRLHTTGIRTKYTDRPPNSPIGEGSRVSTQKASTFRQRRMQIAQQRKWTEERIEKVKHHSRSMNKNVDGTEMQWFHHSDGSEEFHATNHRDIYSSTYLVDEEVYCDPEDVNVSSSHEHDEDSDDDSALECMTIDTVSSLNTNWTNRSDDAFSARSWLPPKLNNNNIHGTPTQKRSKDSFPLKHMSTTADSIHPPLYVPSKKYRKQVIAASKSKEETQPEPNLSLEEGDHFDPEVTIQINNIGRDQRSLPDSNNNESLELDKEQFIVVDDNDDDDDDIPIISSNAVRERASPQTFLEKDMDGPSLVDEKESDDDIPIISSNAVHRERPSPETFLEKDMDGPLMVEEKDPNSLRKKRLSRMLSSKLTNDVVEQDRKNTEQYIVTNVAVLDQSSELLTSPKSHIDISADRPGSQPFDESAIINLHDTLNKSSALESKLDSDLHAVMEKRELEDDKSVQTTKSYMTFATMKTCFTTKPSSPEEYEAAMKRKKHRMYLFHHALNCTHPHPVNADDDLYVPCPEVKHCHALSVLVRHVQTCTASGDSNGEVCEIPRCNAYKKVWNHYRRCAVRTFTSEKNDCRFCSEFWHKYDAN